MTDRIAERVTRAAAAGHACWWINAVLAHRVPPDDGAGHLKGTVVVADRPPEPWLFGLADLRAAGVTRLELRAVEPGDPVGLPGPAEVTRRAVAAGVVLVADALVIVPVPGTDRWLVLPAAPGGGADLGTLSEARSLMRTAMAEITASLPGLEPDDETLAQLTRLRALPAPQPPPGVDPAAATVAGDALRVWWLAGIAADHCVRRDVPLPASIRGLRPLARRAVSVAYSAPLTDPDGPPR